MIKLFASDLDGTLLNAMHMVDPFIRASLREVVASGAHFAIATGRTMRSNHDCGFRGVDAEVVCSNGSIVLDRTGRTVYHRDLDKGFLEELLKAFPAVCFECVGTDRTYVTGSPNDQVAGYVGRTPVEKVKMAAMRLRRKMTQGDCEFNQGVRDVLRRDICKVNARVNDKALERELHAFMDEHAAMAVNAPFSPVMFEITAAGVNKASALAWLAGHLGIGEDEVAVYGDGGNDLVMLERFAHSYAPSNASDAAKRAAGRVIGSCACYAVPRHMVATVRAQ